MAKTLLVLAAVLGLTAATSAPAAADPMKCVVVYDDTGNPVQTVCVPWA